MTYFSARLPVLYPTDAEALFTALEDHNVPYALLEGTKDVWVRDFMPVRTRSGRMLSFRYEPSYLAGAPELRTDFRRDMALQLTPDLIYSAINLDGGASCAMYYNGQYLATPGRELTATLQVFVSP